MRAVLLILSLFLVAAVPRPPVDPSASRLSADAETRWVPFDLTPGNQIRFAMQVDGRPVTAILDTGVSTSVATRRFAQSARLPVIGSPGQGTAVGGSIAIHWVGIRSLALGGLERSGGQLAVVDLEPRATGNAAGIDVLIGADILSAFALDIDYDTRRFRLLPSGRMPFAGQSAPLRLGDRTGVYLTEATLGRHRVTPLIVDTGDGSALTVSQSAWFATGLRPAGMTSAIAYGLGGPVETDVAILPRLAIGTVDATHVEVRIERAAGFADLTGTAGRIGTELLQRYRVLLDPGAGHMVLSPGAAIDRMPVRSTSGLLVGHDRGRLRVLHVMRGGPAAGAGWSSDDLICTVDGATIPADPDGAVDTGWSAGEPGRVVVLGMCDGSERRLTLRAFY